MRPSRRELRAAQMSAKSVRMSSSQSGISVGVVPPCFRFAAARVLRVGCRLRAGRQFPNRYKGGRRGRDRVPAAMAGAELIGAAATELIGAVGPALMSDQTPASGRCRGFGGGHGFRAGCSPVYIYIDEMVAGGDVIQQELGAAITLRVHVKSNRRHSFLNS
jgi:hypothetical protein